MNLFLKKPQLWHQFANDFQATDITTVGERVKDRLTFMGINQETLTDVRDVSDILIPYKAEMIEHFYKRITDVPHLKSMIDQHSTVERLQKTMDKYLDQFLQAKLDRKYVETRIIVGQVHSRISLTAEHFISAHHFLIQSMTILLMEKLHNQPRRMMNGVLAIQKLAAFDQQLIVEVYMENMFRSFLFGISDMLDDVTQIDSTKQLITKMDHLLGESHNVTSAAEEVSASILEVANHAGKVAERTDDAVQSAEQSREVVHDTLGDIQQVGGVYRQVVEEAQRLNEEIEQTNDVITVIQKITEQTNLLALNAGIEAARAGEHGKGFSVVASEVRNLAEHTKQQTLLITESMESLQKLSMRLTEQIGNTGKLVKESVNGAKYASEALDAIVQAMQGINESTSEIAAMTEEQTASVTEIADRNATMHELGTSSQKVATETARLILDLSKQLDDRRLSLLQTNIKLNSKDIIQVAKTDHLLWKWKIYNMILGLETIDSEQVTSYHTCRLGKWYYGDLSASLKDKQAFQQLEAPHKLVHEMAKKAVQCYEEEDLKGAEAALAELQQASAEVIQLLSRLEEEL